MIEAKDIFLKAIDYWVHNNISFPDSFLISFAENYQADLISFDQKMNKLKNEIKS